MYILQRRIEANRIESNAQPAGYDACALGDDDDEDTVVVAVAVTDAMPPELPLAYPTLRP